MTLKEIVDNKRYPILFIGAGVSKRYLKDYPNWQQLLQEYYEKLELDQSYFSYLNSLKREFQNSYFDQAELNFKINTTVASFVEEKFNDLFFAKRVKVPNLTDEEAFSKELSAFKVSIAQRFSKYELKDDVDREEINAFRTFLKKARMIITTNYDGFIEDLLSDDEKGKPVIYVGQNGFFEETIGWSEIYKIHGDYNNPTSIIINETDYEQYDKNSVLISAKVLSTMIYSPIIFLGYSLNDRNVRKLLNDFTSQLPKEDERKKMSRITVIEWQENHQELNEFMQRLDQDEFGYSVIKTDNYKLIYDEIGKINLGLSPKEVLKYQKFIKEIVVSAEKKGSLDAVLVTPTELSDVEKDMKDGKQVVVALGNRKNILVFPDYESYIHDYLFEEDIPEDQIVINLKFAAKEGTRQTRVPFVKYWKKEAIVNGLDSTIREKLQNKIDYEKTFVDMQEKLTSTVKQNHDSIQEILDLNLTLSTELGRITYNMNKFKRKELENYIKKEAYPQFEKIFSDKTQSNNKSYYRKLFKAYDLIVNGDFK